MSLLTEAEKPLPLFWLAGKGAWSHSTGPQPGIQVSGREVVIGGISRGVLTATDCFISENVSIFKIHNLWF